ncbi:hypothetical protein FN846DRAFT_887149 [Sphaerosporella brunnea]|uniref:Uncharacterized protein n=1 Tax=Sphaerosporella brunnea TaxID=1250544 RepID=A0A5J5F7H0_9PEZI|nr:hypothetical protein FN846DRAFT_887149 [Sphaerosporella brunnea]
MTVAEEYARYGLAAPGGNEEKFDVLLVKLVVAQGRGISHPKNKTGSESLWASVLTVAFNHLSLNTWYRAVFAGLHVVAAGNKVYRFGTQMFATGLRSQKHFGTRPLRPLPQRPVLELPEELQANEDRGADRYALSDDEDDGRGAALLSDDEDDGRGAALLSDDEDDGRGAALLSDDEDDGRGAALLSDDEDDGRGAALLSDDEDDARGVVGARRRLELSEDGHDARGVPGAGFGRRPDVAMPVSRTPTPTAAAATVSNPVPRRGRRSNRQPRHGSLVFRYFKMAPLMVLITNTADNANQPAPGAPQPDEDRHQTTNQCLSPTRRPRLHTTLPAATPPLAADAGAIVNRVTMEKCNHKDLSERLGVDSTKVQELCVGLQEDFLALGMRHNWHDLPSYLRQSGIYAYQGNLPRWPQPSSFTLTTHLAYLPISKPSETKNQTPNRGNASYAILAEQLRLYSDKLGKLSVELEDYFQANEVWLSNSGNHTKWNAGCVDRVIAIKTITTDEWLQKAVELGHRLGVDTAEIGVPALHSLDLLLKKKVDEKLRAQAKRVITATKKLAADKKLVAADKELVAAKTLVDATSWLQLRSVPRTGSEAADQERQLIKHRTDGALCEEEAANLRYDAAKSEEEVMKKVAALQLEAARKEVAAAEFQLARERLLYAQAAAGGSCPASSTATFPATSSSAVVTTAPPSTNISAAEGAGAARPCHHPHGPGYGLRDGCRLVPGVPAPGCSTTQARGTSGSSTEVADEQDAVQPQRRRRDFVVSGTVFRSWTVRECVLVVVPIEARVDITLDQSRRAQLKLNDVQSSRAKAYCITPVNALNIAFPSDESAPPSVPTLHRRAGRPYCNVPLLLATSVTGQISRTAGYAGLDEQLLKVRRGVEGLWKPDLWASGFAALPRRRLLSTLGIEGLKPSLCLSGRLSGTLPSGARVSRSSSCGSSRDPSVFLDEWATFRTEANETVLVFLIGLSQESTPCVELGCCAQ